MLTKHFALAEFISHDGAPVPQRFMANVQRLAEQLEVLRQSIGKPIRIVSGYRSPAHNAKVKGAKASQHLTASAADIRVAGVPPRMLKIAVETLIKSGKMRDGGIGMYASWLHYDIGPAGRRWHKVW
jgi:uncharacterized protein YcbK (DUF882 family)